MTEKKRLRLTAGKRQVPKDPRLVIRKGSLMSDSSEVSDWDYVPCAIEGCTFVFSRARHLHEVKEGKVERRADVHLHMTQGVPDPASLPDGRKLCLVPGCLRDLSNAVTRPPPSWVPFKDTPIWKDTTGAYTYSECGPDSQYCNKIVMAYKLHDALHGFPCIVRGCHRFLGYEDVLCYRGPDDQTNYFAVPFQKGGKEGERCWMPGCDLNVETPEWMYQVALGVYTRNYPQLGVPESETDSPDEEEDEEPATSEMSTDEDTDSYDPLLICAVSRGIKTSHLQSRRGF